MSLVDRTSSPPVSLADSAHESSVFRRVLLRSIDAYRFATVLAFSPSSTAAQWQVGSVARVGLAGEIGSYLQSLGGLAGEW